ncbi:hypothetical protein QUA20_02490 [Microcoleus sp. Pol7_A1]|uniref:hypothetical protein n=1 Tax=Microcoleus sp. Pol7_A1 TaxID=2818893 RepID=UPI002FD09B10
MDSNTTLIGFSNTCSKPDNAPPSEVKEVVAVIFPFLTPPPFAQLPFKVGDIVKSGNHYGTITALHQTDRPVIITWDASNNEDSLSWNYTLDEIRVLKISLVPLFIPQKTTGELPACTTIVLANSQQLQFSNTTTFQVESLTEHHILIFTLDHYYLFPINLFPGYPTSCAIDVFTPEQLEASRFLSFNDLKIRAKTHLFFEVPDNLLEIVLPIQKQQIKEKLTKQLSTESYHILDFDIAWEEAWQYCLKHLAKKHGWSGFREGDCLEQRRNQVEQRGIVISLNIQALRPFQIQWDSGEIQSYSLTELKSLGITHIPTLIKLSPNVAYQVSEDGSYFKAWLGFRTKALAKAWLIVIKKLVGRLSYLIDCQIPELQHTGSKYEYVVETPRHKTLKKRLEALREVAELDLEKMPK